MAKKEKQAFKRLKELPAEQVEEVERRLLVGESPADIAVWMHEELGVFKDIKTPSLKKNLERYRANDLKNKVITDLKGKGKGNHVGTLKKRLSAMDEMEALVEIQKGRLEKALVKEATLPGMLTKQATDESRLLKEMLIELGKLQLETGHLPRAPKKMTGTVTNPSTGEKQEFAWTEEQEALYKMLDNVDYKEVKADALPAAN